MVALCRACVQNRQAQCNRFFPHHHVYHSTKVQGVWGGRSDAIILRTTLLNVPGQRHYYELGDVTVQGSLGIYQDAQTAQTGTEESEYYVYSLDTALQAFLFNFPPVGADLGLVNASA
jgi:hypothetical protein